jgi:hypothetical protein
MALVAGYEAFILRISARIASVDALVTSMKESCFNISSLFSETNSSFVQDDKMRSVIAATEKMNFFIT